MSDENSGPGGLRDDDGLAKRAGEQTSAATDVMYDQGRRAGEYLTRNVNEYPLAAVLVAAAIGYGIGYLIHGRSSGQEWRNRREIEESREPRTLFMRSDYER